MYGQKDISHFGKIWVHFCKGIYIYIYIFPTASKNTAGSLRRSCQGCAIAGLFQRCECQLPTVLAVLRPTLMTPKKSIFQVFIFCVFGWGSSETLFGVVWFWDFVWGGGSFEALFGVGVVLRPKTRQKHLQKLHKWLQCLPGNQRLATCFKISKKNASFGFRVYQVASK